MDAEAWTRITALFDRARQLVGAERTAWLAHECPDPAIRAEVVALLEEYDSDPGFLEAPIDPDIALAAAEARVRRNIEGRRVGPYRIVREIGRGGMGVVYEGARDDHEFDRRVAIKLLPAAWTAPALAERFRFERQVLASLDHPNIARVIDAGATDDGVPYLVMEFVEGRPIDAWCREHRLSARQRVELLHRVCAAVAHAHQNLVIHRDLKPANIFVTTSGDPKLLDFGIAAIVSEGEGQHVGRTRTGQSVFTPEYASPEQMRGERATTTTDVYSLGVLLYVLLAERPPYALQGLTLHEAARVASDTDPAPPSRVAPAGAATALRGDLDNIVMKALRKDRHERYPSVADLGADLLAWLEGRPVSASPVTALYRARKFVARHALGVAAAAAVLLAVVLGSAATAWQAHLARVERDKAERRFAQAREFSRALLFDVHDALRPLPGATEPRRLLLARAVQFLDGLAADAGADATLKLELVEGYRRLGRVQGSPVSDNVGDLAGARRSLEAAARLAEEAHALEPHSARTVRALAGAYDDLDTALFNAGDVVAADRAYTRHLATVEQLEREHAHEPGVAADIASSFLNLGYSRGARLDQAGARAFYDKAVQRYETLPASDASRDEVARGHARALQRLGAILITEGRLDEAERRYRQALTLDEAVVARNPGNAPYAYDLTFSLTDLAMIARKRGDLIAAVNMYERALITRQRALDADPRNVRIMLGIVSTHNYLAGLKGQLRQPADAAGHQRASLALLAQIEATTGATPTLRSRRAWARMYLASALLDGAETGTPAVRGPALREVSALLASAESDGRGLDPARAGAGIPEYIEQQRARLRRLAP